MDQLFSKLSTLPRPIFEYIVKNLASNCKLIINVYLPQNAPVSYIKGRASTFSNERYQNLLIFRLCRGACNLSLVRSFVLASNIYFVCKKRLALVDNARICCPNILKSLFLTKEKASCIALTENRLFSRQLSDSFLSAFSHQPKKS